MQPGAYSFIWDLDLTTGILKMNDPAIPLEDTEAKFYKVCQQICLLHARPSGCRCGMNELGQPPQHPHPGVCHCWGCPQHVLRACQPPVWATHHPWSNCGSWPTDLTFTLWPTYQPIIWQQLGSFFHSCDTFLKGTHNLARLKAVQQTSPLKGQLGRKLPPKEYILSVHFHLEIHAQVLERARWSQKCPG